MRATATDEVLGARSWARPSASCMLSCFSHVQHFATPWTVCSPPDSSVHGILQARTEWVAMPSFRGSELTSLMSPALAGGFFTIGTTWEAQG